MPFVDVPDARLFYTDEGNAEGPPLLFIHGVWCESNDWMWQLAAFAQSHRVIAVDLRGHGLSSSAGSYHPRDYAGDLVRLLDHLDLAQVTVIGHSLGALIASTIAVEHADRVEALVVVDPAYGIAGPMADAMPGLIEALRGDLSNTVAASIFEDGERAVTPPNVRTWHRRRVLGIAPEVVAETWAGIYGGHEQIAIEPVSSAFHGRRTCPTLAVLSVRDIAEAERAMGSEVHEWKDNGHWPHQERPDDFNDLLREWLARLS